MADSESDDEVLVSNETDHWKRFALSQLPSKPKDNWCACVSDLLRNNKRSLESFRVSLFNDAKSPENFPGGEIVRRLNRSTSKFSVEEKLVQDCFDLCNFLVEGQPQAITHIIRKRDCESTSSQPSSQASYKEASVDIRDSVAEIAAEVKSLKDTFRREIQGLKEQHQKEVKLLKEKVQDLESRIDKAGERISKLNGDNEGLKAER